tara:strand:- start:8352 stop:10298 length:1947 start_codon:yes stop_codon:yes gene_type:complete
MGNVDYNIKILAPLAKNTQTLPKQSFIPLNFSSKVSIVEPDKNIYVLNALKQSNIERNRTNKYRIMGKFEIITDNTIGYNFSNTPVPNAAWSPEELDAQSINRNWVLQITYPSSKNESQILNTDNDINKSTNVTKGFQVKEFLPYSIKGGIPTPNPNTPNFILPEANVIYKTLIRTTQKHGVTNAGDFIYISPLNFNPTYPASTNTTSLTPLGYHRVIDFEPNNEDYGLVLDSPYTVEEFGVPASFFGTGKSVFDPSSDDTTFANISTVTQIQRCNESGGLTGTLDHIIVFSENHGLNVNNFIDLRGPIISPINNLYKILAIPSLNQFVINYDYESTNNSLSIITLPSPLNYRFCDGVPSEYYFRSLEVLTGVKDYDIYKAAFATNVFSDNYINDTFLFNFDKDLDVTGLRDNLGRPLSELFLTVVKRASCGNQFYDGFRFWSNTLTVLDSNKRITPILENNPISLQTISYWQNYDPTTAGTIQKSVTGSTYLGDFVEYNRAFLNEKILSKSLGRFAPSQAQQIPGSNPLEYNYGQFYGYTYNLHNKIKIRDFSSVIETAFNKPNEILPDYAQINNNGTASWRDLLDVGDFEEGNSDVGVDYPFVNGRHYLFGLYPIYIRRQIPTEAFNSNVQSFVKFNTDKTPNDEC